MADTNPSTALPASWDSLVDRSGDCWTWTGQRLPKGYGRVGLLYAHRMAYAAAHGPIPDGLFVCHRCDNPPCVNPAHLFLGTAKDNAIDCQLKGRRADVARTRRVGESNGMAKLTSAQVAQIRREYAELPRKIRVRRGSLSALAGRYGVTPTMVLMIVRGEYWRGIDITVTQ